MALNYKVRMTPPKTPIEGWRGRVSVDDGKTWYPLRKYVGGGLVSFDSEQQLMKEARRRAAQVMAGW